MGQYENVEKIEQEQNQLVHQKTWFQRHCPTFVAAGTAIAGSMAITQSANAAIAETLLTAITSEVTAVANSQEAIYGLLIVVLIGFLVWRYTKRTTNSG